MIKKTKTSAKRRKNKLSIPPGAFLPVIALAVVLAATGGYWLAGNVFGGKSASTENANRAAFAPPTENKNTYSAERPNPFAPWNAYEEKLPSDVYEPPHDSLSDLIASISNDPDLENPNWIKNSVPFVSTGDGPLIAIVIDDMGVDRGRSKKMWELPPPLTLSFLTYADDLQLQTDAARKDGHELMLHISMEPSSKTVDAGPNVLIAGMEENELRRLVEWGMSRFDGYIGVNNHMGSHFTEDKNGMTVVLQEIKNKGLMFLDSRTSAKTVGPMVASDLGVPHLERNVFLDNEPAVKSINKQLAEVEALAARRGFAIAIGHPRDGTIDALAKWLPLAKSRGFRIAPLSAILKNRMGI
ncbi:MAG: divergent polysaccharide deacetylase family protein, partial [Rhodospirillaceae bacterium]|nr:divergent polysaccharide deacetylase family protein [Rhodospirillaceae bacterium]